MCTPLDDTVYCNISMQRDRYLPFFSTNQIDHLTCVSRFDAFSPFIWLLSRFIITVGILKIESGFQDLVRWQLINK